MQDSELIFFAGGACLQRHGTLVRRTAPWEDVAEEFTRASTGTYIDRNGIVRTAAANVPRLEWLDLDGDGVRETPALLLEPRRVNLLTKAEAFDHANWSKTDVTPTANAATGPRGVATADLMTQGAAGNSILTQVPGTTGGTTYCHSRWLKRGNTDWVLLRVRGLSDHYLGWFNLATGAFGNTQVVNSGVIVDSGVEVGGDGWYRPWIAGNTAAASSACDVFAVDADNSFARVNGGTWYEGGAQLEEGSFPTSLIVTDAASAAREADAFRVLFPPALQGMTGYMRFVHPGAMANDSIPLFIGDGASPSNDPRLYVVWSASSSEYRAVHDNGTASVTDTGLTTSPSAGDLLDLAAELYGADDVAPGAVQIHQRINAGAVESGTKTAGPAGGIVPRTSGQYVGLGSVGDGDNAAAMHLISAKIVLGTGHTISELLAVGEG